MGNKRLTKDFVLKNEKGLHARPASLFVQAAMAFQSDIDVCNLESNLSADGKSVMSMLMLAAPCGTRLRITAAGPDCCEALHALESLIERGFDDD